jgi:hypothetical protein
MKPTIQLHPIIASCLLLSLPTYILTADATPVNISLPCDGVDSEGRWRGVGEALFSLQADKISITRSPDRPTETVVIEVDQLLDGYKCVYWPDYRPNFSVELAFNTTQPNTLFSLRAEFNSAHAGGWKCTYLRATVVANVNGVHSVFIWRLQKPTLANVEWLNSPDRANGRSCSLAEVVLGMGNKLKFNNLRLFPTVRPLTNASESGVEIRRPTTQSNTFQNTPHANPTGWMRSKRVHLVW